MTNRILTDFRHLFNTQNFALFHAVIIGLIAHSGRGTVTSISSDANGVRVETVCTRLGIHWYQPAKLSGLVLMGSQVVGSLTSIFMLGSLTIWIWVSDGAIPWIS